MSATGSFAPGANLGKFGHVRCSAKSRSRFDGNLVERFFNKIKHCRRVATCYDKLAANYLAFVQLASIRLWLRVNASTT